MLINERRPQTAQQLTHLNDGALHGVALADAQEIWFDSSGGARIQGWVVKPPDFDPARRYPLLLEIHGGPQAMFNVDFSPQFQNFAANGYVVIFVNPRGSTGYGTAFGNAILKHYPGPDYDDLMAGVDAVLKQGIVDESRMYVSGCSGGGVLSSWVISHTNRFAAAAVRCPVIDWISMAGETDIPFFTYRFFKKPFWEDPSDWLAESSLMHVGNVKTPTLHHDGRARSPHAHSAKRGILSSAEISGRPGGAAAIRSGIPRHRIDQAIELDAHAAVHDELVLSATAAPRRCRRLTRRPAADHPSLLRAAMAGLLRVSRSAPDS